MFITFDANYCHGGQGGTEDAIIHLSRLPSLLLISVPPVETIFHLSF